MRDGLPEHKVYKDTGCNLAPSCLDCPLVRCKYDEDPTTGRPGWLTAARKSERDAAIVAYYRVQHPKVEGLAAQFRLSERSVLRILALHRVQ